VAAISTNVNLEITFLASALLLLSSATGSFVIRRGAQVT